MSVVPTIVAWVVLLLAGGALLAAARRPRLLQALALAAPLLAGLLWVVPWLLSRPDGPVASLNVAGWQWMMGETGWQLGGAALALLLAAVLHILLRRNPTGPPALPLALAFGLTAAALPVIWAAEARSLVLGLALLAVAWLAAYRLVAPAGPAALLRAALRWLISLFLLWFAAVAPAARPIASLLAALPLLGIWPPLNRRGTGPQTAGAALLLDTLPVLAGATVLAAGLPGLSDVGAVLATVIGLLSMLGGVARAWGELSAERLTTAAPLLLAGLLLVGAVWVGGDAIPVGARLAALAPALLALAAELPPVARFGPRSVAPGVVFAASAGLPFLVGFPLLAGLYGTWGSGAGWALVFVLAALLSLWLAAVAAVIRAAGAGPTGDARAAWLHAVALLPLALGLLHNSAGQLPGVQPLVWAALALPPVAGFLLGRFAPLDAVGGLLRESAALRLPVAPPAARLRALGGLLSNAFADAAAILEGENGLLLLLALLLLLLWIA